MLQLWEESIFKLLVKEERITEDVVEEMRSWDHSGFSVDQSVHLPAGDSAGIERLVQYMVPECCTKTRLNGLAVRFDGRNLARRHAVCLTQHYERGFIRTRFLSLA